MSLFNKILSLTDVNARIGQFQAQVTKLEQDEPQKKLSATGRASFIRRSGELRKQLDDYLKKVEGITSRNLDQEDTKTEAITTIKGFQSRVTRLNKDVVPRPSRQSTIEKSVPPPPAEQPAPQSPTNMSDIQSEEEERAQRKRAQLKQRAASIMYEDDDSDDGSDDEDEVSDGGEKLVDQSHSKVIRAADIQSDDERPKKVEREQTVKREEPKSKQEVPPPQKEPEVTAVREPVITPSLVEGNKFLVLGDFAGEDKLDLNIKKGDIVTVTQTRADGWWTAINTLGFSGLVPKTFLRHFDRNEGGKHEHMQRVEEGKREERPPPPSQPPAPSTRPQVVPPTVPRIRNTVPRMETAPAYSQAASSTPPGCLGEALARDKHLTYSCHLTPRLSESNLGFHDLYWNFHDDMLRKRRVRVSKFVRLVRLENMPKGTVEGALIRMALLDETSRTGRQIVSNVHTIRAQAKNGIWTFNNKKDILHDSIDYCDFLVRSNYKQQDVVLVIEASVIVVGEDGHPSEHSLGIVKLPLVTAQGECRLANKTYAEFLVQENIFLRGTAAGHRTHSRLIMKVMDVQQEMLHHVDSLPDVLLFCPLHVHLLFFFRRWAGITLIRDRENAFSAELISDPLLATFPRVADQPDILDYCRRAFEFTMKTVQKKPEPNQLEIFHKYYMETAFTLIDTAIMAPYSPWDKRAQKMRRSIMDKHGESLAHHKHSAPWLLSQPSRPVSIYEMSVDLMGPHAID